MALVPPSSRFPEPANLSVNAVSQSAKGSQGQFLKPLQRLTQFLAEATGLVLDGAPNDVSFRSENLCGALRGERSWRCGVRRKARIANIAATPASRGGDHEQDEFCGHGWKSPSENQQLL